MQPDINGFQEDPRTVADGSVYGGRLTVYDVQWVRRRHNTFATCTVTVQQLLDAADADLLWTDQDVQRGIKPEKESEHPARELSLKAGYPDSNVYIFDDDKADEIVTQLLAGTAEYLDPLIWSLRPGTFEAHADFESRKIYIYAGRMFLPDSHHRHQAILRAARLAQEN